MSNAPTKVICQPAAPQKTVNQILQGLVRYSVDQRNAAIATTIAANTGVATGENSDIFNKAINDFVEQNNAELSTLIVGSLTAMAEVSHRYNDDLRRLNKEIEAIQEKTSELQDSLNYAKTTGDFLPYVIAINGGLSSGLNIQASDLESSKKAFKDWRKAQAAAAATPAVAAAAAPATTA